MMKDSRVLIVSFCSSSVAPTEPSVPNPGIGSIVEPEVSDFTRAGPRLPTKKPETIRKQPSP